MSFVELPITVAPDAIADEAIAYMRENIPGWEPAEGSLESWLIEAIARMTGELAEVVRQVPAAIFAAFGARFLGITQESGLQATTSSSWTVRDTSGYLIEAGTLVGYRLSGDTAVLLETVADTPVPGGTTTVSGVVLRARDVGTSGNGIPSGSTLELIDALAYVSAVVTTTASAGGAAAETDLQYLARLAAEMQLLSPRPILPGDFAVLAGRVPGVGRALAISGYDPAAGTHDHERTVAIALVDEDGVAVGAGVKNAVEAYLEPLREANFVVAAMDPTFTTINVTFSVHPAQGYVGTEVIASVVAELEQFLSPGVWAGGQDEPPLWLAGYQSVRYLQVSQAIGSVPGVAFVMSLALNGSSADVTMTGPAALPHPGTITGSVA